MIFSTADLCDQHEARIRTGEVQIVAPIFHSYGGRQSFYGPIATLSVFEDNSLVRAALETAGNGRVLVVDGGGSLRCALVGDQLAQLGARNGWAGILVNGCIRDSLVMAKMEFGVLALATHPLKSIKLGAGEINVPVIFGETSFTPGAFLYADADGIVVAPQPF